MNGEAFPILVDLVERGLIRILDLAFISKGEDGSVSAWTSPTSTATGCSTSPSSQVPRPVCWTPTTSTTPAPCWSRAAPPGVLVYENVWAAPFATAVRRSGGQLVASGRIPVQAILAALESTEPVG